MTTTDIEIQDRDVLLNTGSVATPFFMQFIYGASIAIITLIAYLLYDLFPEFFIKYLVFILFLFSVAIFSFFLPSHSGWMYKLNTAYISKNKKRAKMLGKQIGKRFFGFLGIETAIEGLILAFLTNPTMIVPIILPLIMGIVAGFNATIDFFSDSFKKYIK